MMSVELNHMDQVEAGAPESTDWRHVRNALLANPDRLRDDPDLLTQLGLRLDAANVVDFGPVALSRVSAAHHRESSERRRLEAMAQANYAAQTQTHAAIIDILGARDLDDLAHRVDRLARIRFGLAVGVLALEAETTSDGWRFLVDGQVDLLMAGGLEVRLGRIPTATGLFGAEALDIRSVALVRLRLWDGGASGVLAFGSTDPEAFSDDMGTELLTFLARVVERTAQRWPKL
jgi:uncharacterized protein YigA (DUF484 family)